MNDRNYVQSLERALKILEIFGSSGQGFTLTEVADFCSLNKTATNRFLFTLSELGYLTRDENKRYFLTAKILSLGFGFLNSSNLRTISKIPIDNLSTELKQTINLAVLDDIEVIYIYRKEQVSYLKYNLYDGSKLPAHCTSAGKILLAGLDDSELESRLSRMDLSPVTRRTITNPKLLLKELLHIREQGYSTNDGELSLDLFAIAAPIIDSKGKVVAAINVTMESKNRSKKNEKLIIEKILKTGATISSMYGYLGAYSNFL